MDTKLKNIKYSAGTKAAAVILIWLCFLCSMGSVVFLLYNEETARTGSYYETYSFKKEFERMIYNTIQAKVRLKSIENINASNEAESVKEEKRAQLDRMEDKLSRTINFVYYIKASPAGEDITNITASLPQLFVESKPVNVYVSKEKVKSTVELDEYRYNFSELLTGTNYEVYAALLEPLSPGDAFYDDFNYYNKTKQMVPYANIALIASPILLIAAAAYLAIAAGRREKGGEIVFSSVDRIYADVYTLLVIAAAFISILIVGNFLHPETTIFWVIFFTVLSADAFIGISYVLSMIRQIKGGRLLKNTLAAVLIKKTAGLAKACFDGRLFKPSVLLILLGYALINGILFDVGVDINNGAQEPIFTFLLLGFNAVAIYFAAKSLQSLSLIITAVKEISSGNLDYALNSCEISAAFSSLAEGIMDIQGGMKKAVLEAVKGERMKTELITNVSHDLKTPLTSIVNYVDLLKKEELNNQKADEYVNILEEKALRLKHLIEDLVEASKASSGNIPVNAVKVDLHELVMQACGEYEEKIEAAGLDIRISTDKKNVFVLADGKQMGRIIENLFSNAVKYSMPNSRVYVNLAEGNEFGILTIKNISAFPLNIPPEQLTERFVRGDVSRTTEGSGLGLSIAQSLTGLQGGNFKVEIDGDLFKVTAAIPLWKETA